MRLDKTHRIIKFETIKNRAKDEVSRRLTDGHCVSNERMLIALYTALNLDSSDSLRNQIKNTSRHYERGAHKIIDHWDVRSVSKLIALFPCIISNSLRNKSIRCDLNDKGWDITFS